MKQNILITGGTRGLGYEYARYLSSKGYNLALTDISSKACGVYDNESVDSVIGKLSESGRKIRFYEADLTDPKKTESMFANVLSDFGSIYGVVTNAGGDISGNDSAAAGGKAPENTFFIDATEWDNIFDRNFTTCLNTLRVVVPHLISHGAGKIVTVSSVNASFGVPKETAYAVGKCAVVHLTRCLSVQLREKGINVNCLMPGPIKTGRFLSTLKGRNPHDLKGLDSTAKLDRIGVPQDISPVVEFLLSDASDFVSGQVIRVDGGAFTHPV